jgi:acyl-CoA thioesterase-2
LRDGKGFVEKLLELLDLEAIEINIYRGQNRPLGARQVYGGQVFAQALVAARRTVDGPREAHSVHGYFILPGDLDAPIVYFVDRLRDGSSFTTRRVTAIQHGRAIFNMSASFHVVETGLEHQSTMPDVPPPEDLVPELQQVRDSAHRIPESLREILTQDRPLDFRRVEQIEPFTASEPRPAVKHLWFRATTPMPDNPTLHQAVLAYASDYSLITTSLLPHGIGYRTPGLRVASLDHSLWMHRPFRVDEWLLYAMDSPTAGGGRGFTRGSIYARNGALVASVAQEGLVRYRPERNG